ncbi:facilitated trehalose transporter Tret1-like [Photinus pyralis]|uniref:facilitated trehalose transporter Tret1-like n=1 Tax=Photinus pyralis TaxID=7054 RepID=UPI001266F662|nr:facilitated trehalose transporter Tret1-like [Photinus pyralis]
MFNRLLAKLNIVNALLPQIYAGAVASSVHLWIGVVHTYSSVLIPQLRNGADALEVTKNEEMWIINCVCLVALCQSVLGGILTDKFGRLPMLKSSLIFHAIGWVTIALGRSGSMLILGRTVTGIAIGCVSCASLVYVAEVSTPTLRAPLLALSMVFHELGSLVTYIMGYLTSWRAAAWITCGSGTIATLLVFSLPQSPSWLVSKNREAEARKSLRWFNRNDTDIVEKELETLKSEARGRVHKKIIMRNLILPTVYRPFLILTLLGFAQQFAGMSILARNSIIFFEELGTQFDPYIVFSCMALLRIFTGLGLVVIMGQFGRRPIMFIALLGVFLSMIMSGLYTAWIDEGTTHQTWVPLFMLNIYTIFMVTIATISATLLGELFPGDVRGLITNITWGLNNVYTFLSIFAYPSLLSGLHGIANVQFFFAGVSALACLILPFLPETHMKRLSEIEAHFSPDSRRKSVKKFNIEIDIIVI